MDTIFSLIEICLTNHRESYRFWTTWGWINKHVKFSFKLVKCKSYPVIAVSTSCTSGMDNSSVLSWRVLLCSGLALRNKKKQ